MQIKNSKFIIGISLVVLTLAGISMHNNWGKLKYETRRINIRLFQTGEVAGGTLTQLPASFHRQEHSLSCEIAALKMALSVYGLDIPESELISQMKFDPTIRTKTTWGDPYKGFVGDIDDKMMRNGYGVYWDPIAEVGSKYADAKVYKFTPSLLAAEIADGHPVVVWGYMGRGKKIVWTTPEGKQITGINGEHARTAIGFTGSIDEPTGFVILDPIYGRLYWRTKDLMNNWAPFEHMGVVVYPKIFATN